MIHVIMGLKGSGKTKKMIDSINEVLTHASGERCYNLLSGREGRK